METQNFTPETTWTLEESTPREEVLRPPDRALPPSSFQKIKSSQRLNYEAQVQVIQNQIGNLEKVRSELGLTRRKLAQLLLVDPSAWSRWMREGTAPPHVYRALQWFMILQEKVPGLTPQYFLGPNTEFSPLALRQHVRDQIKNQLQTQLSQKSSERPDAIDAEYRAEMVAKIQRLELELEQTRKISLWSIGIGVALALTAAALLIRGRF